MQLNLFCQAATAATRRAAFPADEGLDPGGVASAQAAAARIRRVDAAWTSPGRAARQTAMALGVTAQDEPALREIDYAAWAGREMADIDPASLSTWLADPRAAPHGGESIDSAVARTAAWMHGLVGPERVVAVTHASIIRAAIITALAAPLSTFWRIDVAPLCRVSLQRRGDHWTLRSLGELLVAQPIPDQRDRG